jgi:hypothetical protein
MHPPIAAIIIFDVAIVYGIALLVVNKFQRKFVFQTYPIFCTQKTSPGPGPPHFAITTSDCETLDALWMPVTRLMPRRFSTFTATRQISLPESHGYGR